MNFRSDNVTGAAPAILEAVVDGAAGSVGSYGADPATERLQAQFRQLFETDDLVIVPVATGTAANSLAVATFAPPWGHILAHEASHLISDECNGPELQTGGAKLIGLPGADGKIDPAALAARLVDPGAGNTLHHGVPAVLSLTQATEAGTVYRPAEVAALARLARDRGLAVHMDGARFGNAVASLGCAPADLTWRAGIDVLSFGGTKNGCLAAEAIVLFRPEKAAELAFRRKRAGHLWSKMRFLSVQLEAYLRDGLWLDLARAANAEAQRLAAGLARLPGARLAHPVEANEIFITLPEAVLDGLEAAGFGFYRWAGTTIRLVTAFNTSPDAVDALIAEAERLSRAAA